MGRFIALALFALAATGLWAYDFSAAGFSLSGSRDVEGRSFTVLTDATGGEILFAADAEPDDSRIAALRTIAASVRGWKSLQVAQIRALNLPDRLQVIVIPAQFRRDGVDLLPALPAGLQFIYDGGTYYDFKVKSGQFVVRVRGLYIGEDGLAAAALSAFENPAAYGDSTDPAALLRRISDLEARPARDETALMAALNGGRPIDPAAIAKIQELKRANPSLDKASAAAQLKAQGLRFSSKELDTVFMVLFGERGGS